MPRGLQRLTPPEGLQAGKYFIPGDTIVQNPTYTMFYGTCPTGLCWYRSPLLPLLGQDPWRVGSRYCHGIRLHPALRKIPLVLSGRTIRMGWAFYTDASRCQMRGTFPTRTNSSPSAGRRGPSSIRAPTQSTTPSSSDATCAPGDRLR